MYRPASPGAACTIYDVAQAAGVSIKTVSRVLNREPNVRADTRDRVNSAISTLHYRPNMAARGLAGARSYLLGLLVDEASTFYLGGVQRGATVRCRQAGYHLMVEPVPAGSPDSIDQIRALVAHARLEGVILTPPVCDDLAVLDALDELGAPYVRIAPGHQLSRGARVEVDDRAAAAQMTRRLIELGHTELGFICGPSEHLAALRRREGFLDALREAGLDLRTRWDVQGDFTFESGSSLAEAMFATPTARPTAIFAANDDMALGVLATAHRMGLSTPRDISVAGFDDTAAAQLVWPRLTSMRQPVVAMGAAAADLLIDRTARAPQHSVAARHFDCTLQLRESVAARE